MKTFFHRTSFWKIQTMPTDCASLFLLNICANNLIQRVVYLFKVFIKDKEASLEQANISFIYLSNV